MPRRRPGRPARQVLTRDRILEAALVLLEQDGLDGVTIRALARRLRVDPMAIYHYVEDRHALLREAAALAYTRLPARAGTAGTWQARLVSLAVAYVELLSRAGELLRYLTAREEAAVLPTRIVEARFRTATEDLALAPRDYRAAHDAFVDFVHGFSLGVRGPLSPALRRRLRDELGILLAGIAARAAV
ncbi:MAG TPA: helix-turn-helix domain-containing protein [Kofleriaceae bacterium]|nr:helix-turn-helix domain-containing protein [Kofleriaceae bacterium]